MRSRGPPSARFKNISSRDGHEPHLTEEDIDFHQVRENLFAP